jgi:hypothetical protein
MNFVNVIYLLQFAYRPIMPQIFIFISKKLVFGHLPEPFFLSVDFLQVQL